MTMHAFLVAGGRGVRLRPYTTCIPKPLVPIGDECAILEVLLRQLSWQGFERVTIAIGHLGHMIRAYAGDGRQWGLEIDYVTEDMPLGTMGPAVASLDRLPEHFLVMNGDILTDLDFAAVLAGHVESGAPLTVAAYSREVKIDFGVLRTDEGSVISFEEKPSLFYDVSMGVYGLSRTTLQDYPAGKRFGFDELVLDLLASNVPPRIHAFAGYWLDIGRPDDYDLANREFSARRSTFLPDIAGLPRPALAEPRTALA